MRKIQTAILLLVALGAILTQAQEVSIVIERMQISLWPEYDDPRLLVIYRGELAEAPQGPLVFTIPATAQVHAAAHVGPDGRLLANDWQILPADNHQQLVIFTPGSRQFQFEYYDDMIGPGPKKSFIFQFQSSRYEIKDLEIEVQQPLRAWDLAATPSLQAQGVDARGFGYFSREVGAVPAGTVIEQRVSYMKTDAEPSVRPASSRGLFTDFPWRIALAVVAFAVGFAGLGWLWWDRRQSVLKPKPSAQRHLSPQPQTRFCAQCGHEFRIEERFCSQCGRPRD